MMFLRASSRRGSVLPGLLLSCRVAALVCQVGGVAAGGRDNVGIPESDPEKEKIAVEACSK